MHILIHADTCPGTEQTRPWPLMLVSRLTVWSCHWANIKWSGIAHRRCLFQTWVLLRFWRKNRVPRFGLTMTLSSRHQSRFVSCWREWGDGLPLGSAFEVGIWPFMWRRKQSHWIHAKYYSWGASPDVYGRDCTTTTAIRTAGMPC